MALGNNLGERMLRPCAISRQTIYIFGSDDGRRAAAVLYSVMASAKSNQVEPFTYVHDLLVQLSRQSPPAAAALLPNA